MKRICIQLFSAQKYFMDNKFQNISVETHDELGSLSNTSEILSDRNINMSFIRSRFSNVWTSKKKYGVDITISKQTPQVLQDLKKSFSSIGGHMESQKPIQVPWFPRKLSDLNLMGKELLEVKDEVNKDHPQFTDLEYRKRRDFIAEVAKNYQFGERIPDIPYSEEEVALWKNIYSKLRNLHRNSMSQRYENQMKKLQKQFLFSERIPQLSELASYLKNKTGFIIKPTHGILSQRQFLNCFAFRVFCCTQYLRHTGTPDYTPQPDIVHEIVGHVPMFADPDIAELSQQIGLLSLGASDAQVSQLGALYWYTMQFGVCKEGDKKLGYGAGIASSIGEIQHLVSNNARFKPLEPLIDCNSEYPIQKVQDCYRVTESFEQSIRDLEVYGLSVMKPFTSYYNFETNEVDYDRNIEGVFTQDKGPQF